MLVRGRVIFVLILSVGISGSKSKSMKCAECMNRGVVGQIVKGFPVHVMCKLNFDFKVADIERDCQYYKKRDGVSKVCQTSVE